MTSQEQAELANQLRLQEVRDHHADELRKQLDNLPSPPTGEIQPQNNNASTQNQAAKNKIDPTILQTLQDSILDSNPNIKWEDIKGLSDVKKVLNETIVLPTMRPDIFQGLYAPSRGILLYGPPGTGKTLLAKAIATECKSTFFSISASTLTSKWMGEGEKLMRGLF